jgi:Polyketide cyclase / dehydrase and lipid transport
MAIQSKVELAIDAPQTQVAHLFADPRNSTKWMRDIERYEPIGGEPGTPGSTYRLVPKRGKIVFTVTVVERDLPTRLQLSLDASNVTVAVSVRMSKLAKGRTLLTSEEVFRFKGLWNTVFGFVAQAAVRKAHRRHIEAFKRFAELDSD